MFEQLAQHHPYLPKIASVSSLLVIAWLAYLLTSRVLLAMLHRVAARTSAIWDDALI